MIELIEMQILSFYFFVEMFQSSIEFYAPFLNITKSSQSSILLIFLESYLST